MDASQISSKINLGKPIYQLDIRFKHKKKLDIVLRAYQNIQTQIIENIFIYNNQKAIRRRDGCLKITQQMMECFQHQIPYWMSKQQLNSLLNVDAPTLKVRIV